MYIFKGDKLLAGSMNNAPDSHSSAVLPELQAHVVNSSSDLPQVWRDIPQWCEVDGVSNESDYEWLDLREVWSKWGEEAFAHAGAVYQYMNWLRSTRFCSRCAAPLSPKTEDRGLACPKCGRVVYAPLHPAVIVAVERDGKLLLAHNTRMPEKRYSIIAGFVEPGEPIERTVEREIMEEVGIEVQDVRYFGSQSWPFPCSLMLGFTARWKSGELHPDGVELNEAAWFAPKDFPDIPSSVSISRKLIDDFAARHGKRMA